MPYHFSQKDGPNNVEIAGYFFAQPFTFSADSTLVRDPKTARLAVTIALTRWNDQRYPSITNSLAETGDIRIGTPSQQSPILTGTGFRTASVSSSQSLDLALTTWIFEGGNGSVVSFTPPHVDIEANPGADSKEKRVSWFGYATTGGQKDVQKLNLSYVAPQIGFSGLLRDLMAVDMLGVANIQGSGSLLNWVLGLPNDAYMPMLAIKDVSRGEHAKTEIGGIHPAQRKQMNEAKGVVWACNGIFNRVRAADLASFAREIGSVAGVMRQAAHNGNGIFRGLTQPLSVTRTGFGLEQDSFSIKSSNHEGLSFWDLKQLVGANAALMF